MPTIVRRWRCSPGQGACRPARLRRASWTSRLNSPLPNAPAATACECGRCGDLIELDHSIWTGPRGLGRAWSAGRLPCRNRPGQLPGGGAPRLLRRAPVLTLPSEVKVTIEVAARYGEATAATGP